MTQETDELRVTQFCDVCGGTDELKRLLIEEPERASSSEGRETLRSLLADGMYMLGRMEARLRAYQAFRDALAAVVETMRGLEHPRFDAAAREAGRARALLEREGTLATEEIIDHAEAIRQVANDTERALRRHMEASIAAGRVYLRLKGTRSWDDGSTGSAGGTVGAEGTGAASGDAGPEDGAAVTTTSGATALPPGVPEAWLPPPPHREMILDWLRRGRAVLLSNEEVARFPAGPQGREPLVWFEDGGGVMPLRAVRWSDEVRNFYPLGREPHPRGLLYRKRRVAPPTRDG